MEVKRVIVHELKKQVKATKASLDLSEKELVIDETAVRLVTELNNRYINLNSTHAVFADGEEEAVFPTEFKEYSSKLTSAAFKSFSVKTIKNLKERVEGLAPAKGGYLVYVDYTENGDFLGVFLIRNTSGMLFRKAGSSKTFKINPSEHIDFEKMAMGCRINKSLFANGGARYLSFVKRRNEELSDYFVNWIAANDSVDDLQDTKNLYELLREIDVPNDDAGQPMDRSAFLEKVFDFIVGSERKVNLKTLSAQFYGDDNKLTQVSDQKGIQINSEFRANTRILKKFKLVKVKSDDIELSFPNRLYNTKVRVDQSNGNMVVIESESLANKILAEILSNGSSDNQ